MKRTTKPWINTRPLRPRTAAIGAALLTAACVSVWVVGPAAAQFRPGNPARRALGQVGRPPRPNQRPVREIQPEKPKGAGLQKPFTAEERRMVIRGIGRPEALLRTLRQLNLSDDQRAKMIEVARREGNRLPVLNQLFRAQNLALEEAISRANFDPKLVEQRANELAETAAQRIKAQAQIMSQIRQILTPEQGIRFRELMEQERNRLAEEAPPPQTPPR